MALCQSYLPCLTNSTKSMHLAFNVQNWRAKSDSLAKSLAGGSIRVEGSYPASPEVGQIKESMPGAKPTVKGCRG